MVADQPILTAPQRAFLATLRRVILVTIAADGRPRPIPICFVIDPDRPILWTPIDDKPKHSDDPATLARVRDIAEDPRVAVIADRWDEDWSRLAWLRCEGRATLGEPGAPGHQVVVDALRTRYPQYLEHRLETRPLVRVEIERATDWGAIDPA